MVKKLSQSQRYILSGLFFAWLAAFICDTRGALALAAVFSAVVLIIAGAKGASANDNEAY